MDESCNPSIPAGGMEIKSAVLAGPTPVRDADAELTPLVSELIAVISSAATNLVTYAAKQADDRGASRRLCALTALCACGELRALLLLCMSRLGMEGRVQLRALNECLKRVVVYYRDAAFASETEGTLPNFQAAGLAKLDAADRERFAKRDEETARRFETMMKEAKPPIVITKNPVYMDSIIASLDPFRQWSYGQVVHATPIALAEISSRISPNADSIYDTDDGVQMLVAAVGMGLNITAHLVALGVEVKDTYHALEERFFGILDRSGLGPRDDAK